MNCAAVLLASCVCAQSPAHEREAGTAKSQQSQSGVEFDNAAKLGDEAVLRDGSPRLLISMRRLLRIVQWPEGWLECRDHLYDGDRYWKHATLFGICCA